MILNYKKGLVFLTLSVCFFVKGLGQGSNDWFKNVAIINSGKPIDFSFLVESAGKNREIVCIGIVNIDLTNDSLEKLDLSREQDFSNCLPNFSLDKFRVKCYNYTGHNQVDLYIKWMEESVKKYDGGKRSSFYIITSNPKVIASLDSDIHLRRGLSLFAMDTVKCDFVNVRVYSSMEIEKAKVAGDFCWKLNQNFTYFSNLNLAMPKTECSDSLLRKVGFNLKANFGVYGRDQFAQNFQSSFGFEFKKGNSRNVFINVGIQKTKDFLKSTISEDVIDHVSPTNQEFNELLVSSSNVKEKYVLNSTVGILGLDFKRFFGEGISYWGMYGNFLIPIISDLKFENTFGEFDYVGLSNSIQEPLTNIPDLGLVSNVSYVGYKGELDGKLKPFGDAGFLLGLSLGKEAPLDLNFSIGYISLKKFVTEKASNVISDSYGNYNSLLTVNNSQVIIPGYLNFGIGIRKYLN